MSAMRDIESLLPAAIGGTPIVERAFTHISSGRPHNERLEFLGDAIVGAVIAAWLYRNRQDEAEGGLSRFRASLVSRRGLSLVAREYALGERLHLSLHAKETRADNNDRILSSVVEALTGAVFIECGWEQAVGFVEAFMASRLQALPAHSDAVKDHKTRLQELTQSRHVKAPQYRIAAHPDTEGSNAFKVVCLAGGKAGSGQGSTRKSAELGAAAAVLEQFGVHIDKHSPFLDGAG